MITCIKVQPEEDIHIDNYGHSFFIDYEIVISRRLLRQYPLFYKQNFSTEFF